MCMCVCVCGGGGGGGGLLSVALEITLEVVCDV